jgi:hypothetical protein
VLPGTSRYLLCAMCRRFSADKVRRNVSCFQAGYEVLQTVTCEDVDAYKLQCHTVARYSQVPQPVRFNIY